MLQKAIVIMALMLCSTFANRSLSAESNANCSNVPSLNSDGYWAGTLDELVNGYCDHYGQWVHRLLDWYWWNNTSVPAYFTTRAMRSNALARNEIALPTNANVGQHMCIRPGDSGEWLSVVVRDVAQLHHATSHVMYSDSGLEINSDLFWEWRRNGFDNWNIEVLISDSCHNPPGSPIRLKDWFAQNAIFVGGYSFAETQLMSPAP